MFLLWIAQSLLYNEEYLQNTTHITTCDMSTDPQLKQAVVQACKLCEAQ